ncbi:hypothetical protein [Avibacterium paragallinarum]|uniref:Uncharacterized protein n=1 Tax=Avibacterium paragallinarum TaxID=728 RepID=A0ABU7QSL4_AVIPA|nr:hypothetical protein [Avibacterium paragallinarum]
MYNDFKKGFEEGYKMIMGQSVLLPLVPLQPLTPLGSTPFREGLKLGIKAAKQNNPNLFNNIFR